MPAPAIANALLLASSAVVCHMPVMLCTDKCAMPVFSLCGRRLSGHRLQEEKYEAVGQAVYVRGCVVGCV